MKRRSNNLYTYGTVILAVVLLYILANSYEGFQNVPPPPMGMPPPMGQSIPMRPPMPIRITPSSLAEIKSRINGVSAELNRLNTMAQGLTI